MNNESSEPKCELVKFTMGNYDEGKYSLEDDPNFNFDQFEYNKKKFGISSTYDETYYTTKLNMAQYTEEQKERAANIEREIESKNKGWKDKGTKKNGYNNEEQYTPEYNEDEDEEMDNSIKNDSDLNDNYDKFITGKVIYSIEDIEAKQFSMRSQDSSAQPVELDQEDNTNNDNCNEIYNNEALGNEEEKFEQNYEEDQDTNDEIEISTNDDGELKDDRDQKIGLDLKSNAFTPKLKGTASSTKSIDEFDTSNNNSTSTQKESGAKKLKASSTTFKPGMKSTSNSFKPVNSRPIPSISQSQTAPYSYQPIDTNGHFSGQNQTFTQQNFARQQPAPGLNQNWSGNPYAPPQTNFSDQSNYNQYQPMNGNSYQQYDHNNMQMPGNKFK